MKYIKHQTNILNLSCHFGLRFGPLALIKMSEVCWTFPCIFLHKLLCLFIICDQAMGNTRQLKCKVKVENWRWKKDLVVSSFTIILAIWVVILFLVNYHNDSNFKSLRKVFTHQVLRQLPLIANRLWVLVVSNWNCIQILH